MCVSFKDDRAPRRARRSGKPARIRAPALAVGLGFQTLFAGAALAEDAEGARRGVADAVAVSRDDTFSAAATSRPVPDDTKTSPQSATPSGRLGANPLLRFLKYQILELGKDGPPVDPTVTAPPSIREGWPTVPQTAPPMPFTDWPYGGATLIGDNRTASVDSPLMVAIANTGLGKLMGSDGVQAYGWIDYGGNISSSKQKGGNAPAAYDYNPNNLQLDQAVLYVERTPDTVQTDHIDWGFRVSAIAGENYRYTTSYGLASYQLLKHNSFNGYDFPMVYGELWIPQIMRGMMIRVGRYISIPDIEAQLAPNNYMYTHSISYTFDNYTNEGVQTTLAVTKQVMVQVGVSVGTETTVWNLGQKKTNFFLEKGLGADPLYPGAAFPKDPGAQASLSLCVRYQSRDSRNDVNLCANGINDGRWGYNNLQWYGLTAYHAFNKRWHISYEFYNLHQSGVPNANNPTAANIYKNGGTPFSPQFIPFNSPALAQCNTVAALRCTATAMGSVFYLNYSPDHLDNISIRAEVYDDLQGQRTGYKTTYTDLGLGWQHWLSPQIELRPEFTYYTSGKAAFDLGLKKYEKVLSGDVILHY